MQSATLILGCWITHQALRDALLKRYNVTQKILTRDAVTLFVSEGEDTLSFTEYDCAKEAITEYIDSFDLSQSLLDKLKLNMKVYLLEFRDFEFSKAVLVNTLLFSELEIDDFLFDNDYGDILEGPWLIKELKNDSRFDWRREFKEW